MVYELQICEQNRLLSKLLQFSKTKSYDLKLNAYGRPDQDPNKAAFIYDYKTYRKDLIDLMAICIVLTL